MNTLNGNFIERSIPNIKNATLNLLIGDQVATMNLADFKAAIAPSSTSSGLKMKDDLPLSSTLNNVVDSNITIIESPLQLSTESVGISRTVALSAGATNPRLFNEVYTINNSGAQTGTLTGLFLNATETALNGITHNLIDLQVGGVSKMIVKGSGNVGVGTSTPSVPFEVLRTGRSMIRVGALSNNESGYEIYNDGSFKWQMYNANGSNDLRFFDGDIRVVFKNGGDVGIGTILGAVSARLHVKSSGTTSATTSLLVQNSANVISLQITDNNLLCLGGTTSSFPAIKRNGTEVYFRLANDSGFCNVVCENLNYQFILENGAYGYNRLGGGLLVDTSFAINKEASAMAEIRSTTKGFLPPRMTTTQKNAIATPAAGLVVFDTTLAKLCVYTTVWETITSS